MLEIKGFTYAAPGFTPQREETTAFSPLTVFRNRCRGRELESTSACPAAAKCVIRWEKGA